MVQTAKSGRQCGKQCSLGKIEAVLWKQHVTRKEAKEKDQETVTWRDSRTQRRANYRLQVMVRCHYGI